MTVVAAARPENRRAALLLERLQVRHKRPKLVVWDDPAPVRRADDRGIQESSGIDLSGDWGLGTPPSSFGPWQLMPLPGGAQTKVRGPLVAQTSIGRLAQPCGAEPTRSRKYLQMTLFRGVRRRASLCPTRPVTPEVAGSSPVAPVSQNACKSNSFVVCLGANSCSRFRRLLPAYQLAVEVSTRSSCKSRIRRTLRR